MHRTVRMLGIVMALQSQSMTIPQLANRFECSTKTIQRDLTALEDLHIPIVTSRGIGGGVRLDPS